MFARNKDIGSLEQLNIIISSIVPVRNVRISYITLGTSASARMYDSESNVFNISVRANLLHVNHVTEAVQAVIDSIVIVGVWTRCALLPVIWKLQRWAWNIVKFGNLYVKSSN